MRTEKTVSSGLQNLSGKSNDFADQWSRIEQYKLSGPQGTSIVHFESIHRAELVRII